MGACSFCSPDDAVMRNAFAYARFDKYPFTPGHLLILTLRQVASWFEITEDEKLALRALLDEGGACLRRATRRTVATSGSMSRRRPGRRSCICTFTSFPATGGM
jgi:diadenosine tetraphosphate (Ap4A) HIT family hydrolase